MLSKPTLLYGDARVSVHCHYDCHLQSDCRRDCSLGTCRWMLVATWLTWVTVAMSTKPGDRHHLGGHSVAVFGVWVWVWVRVGVHGLHNALPRMATVCGWLSPGLVGLAPKLGVNGALWATIVLDILNLVLCQVRTLPWCLPPNRHPILPHERLSAQTWSIVPLETLGWEATTFDSIYTQKLYMRPDLPQICGFGPATMGDDDRKHPGSAVAMDERWTRIRIPPPQHWEPGSLCVFAVWVRSLQT